MQPQDDQTTDNNQPFEPTQPLPTHEPDLGGEIEEKTPAIEDATSSSLDTPSASVAPSSDEPSTEPATDEPNDIFASLPAKSEAETTTTEENVEAPVAPVAPSHSSESLPEEPAASVAPLATPAYPDDVQLSSQDSPSTDTKSYASTPANDKSPEAQEQTPDDHPDEPLPPLATGGPVVG